MLSLLPAEARRGVGEVNVAQSWYSASGQNGSSRYCYLYSAKELESTVPVVKYLKTKARLVQIFFNNHPGGAAAVNAKKLKELLV